jgi:hypothetical protein
MDEGIQSKREYYTERRQRNEYPSALRSAIDNLIEEGKAKIKARKGAKLCHSSTEEKPEKPACVLRPRFCKRQGCNNQLDKVVDHSATYCSFVCAETRCGSRSCISFPCVICDPRLHNLSS